MPLMENVKVLEAEKIWASPDGNRTIHKLKLDYQGSTVLVKTFSQDLTVGWEGTLESYEKEGSKGPETFVKQPPKDFTPGAPAGGFKGKPAFDSFTMYLSYAKDLVVALQESTGYDKTKFEALLKATIEGGNALYAARPDAPKKVDTSLVEEVFDVDS